MPFDDLIQFPNSQSVNIHVGDCIDLLRTLPECHFQTCVTSPPYLGLRDYKVDGQIGMESTPDAYVTKLVEVFREVRRVLRDDGTVWLNIGDSYATTHHGRQGNSHGDAFHSTGQAYIDNVTGERHEKEIPTGFKSKDLLMIPARVAIAIQADGWYLRSAIVWNKPNPMPESVKDRPTSAYEMVFFFAKSERYYYDADAIREPHKTADRPGDRRSYKPGSSSSMSGAEHQTMNGSFAGLPLNPAGRNARNVWTIAPQPFKGAHFATMAPELARRCILAGCPEGGNVLDPFGGAGTTGLVAGELNRLATMIELNPDYADIARNRLGHLVKI